MAQARGSALHRFVDVRAGLFQAHFPFWGQSHADPIALVDAAARAVDVAEPEDNAAEAPLEAPQ